MLDGTTMLDGNGQAISHLLADIEGSEHDALRRRFGDGLEGVLNDDPYLAMGHAIEGAFQRCDRAAMMLGIENDDPRRIRAGILEAMRKARTSGHCHLPAIEIGRQAGKVLGLTPASIRPVLDDLDGGELMRSGEGNNESYAPRDLHFAERGIARTLLRLSAGRPPWQIANPEAALQVANRHTGKPLTGSQREAFLGVLKNKVSIITGGPGTGKTTLLRALLHALKRAGARPKQAAPTGRAAMNMIDATGMDAETVHLLLGRSDDGRGFRHGPDEPLDCDVMVVDEGSMMDVLLLHGLVSALPSHAALLLVGDNDQLEPVGPGRPFGDAIESGRIAVYRLTEIMRQAAGSRIITGCDAIRRGQVPKTSQNPAESDLLFYRVSDPNKVAATIVDLAARGIPKLLGIDALRDVQVLSPMNVRILGTTHLQPLLREAIDRTSGPEIRTRHGNFARGDKVLHVRNDYRIGVRNGEIGIIEGVEPRSGTVTVAYADRLVPYDRFAMEDLRHGYGVSVHKSQGSEYPAVIMPVVTEHAFMLRRRLLLTALSRGKQMTVMVGSEAALERAVANARDDSRHTNLKRLLMEG